MSFNTDQPRDEHGRWTADASGGAPSKAWAIAGAGAAVGAAAGGALGFAATGNPMGAMVGAKYGAEVGGVVGAVASGHAKEMQAVIDRKIKGATGAALSVAATGEQKAEGVIQSLGNAVGMGEQTAAADGGAGESRHKNVSAHTTAEGHRIEVEDHGGGQYTVKGPDGASKDVNFSDHDAELAKSNAGFAKYQHDVQIESIKSAADQIYRSKTDVGPAPTGSGGRAAPELLTRALGNAARSLDRTARTVEVIAVSGPAPAVVVNRAAPDGSVRPWIEELDVAGADLSAFAGRPALRQHRATVEDAVGVVEVPRIEGGQIVARVRFDNSPEADGLIGKIEVGSVRGVSVGYVVHRWQPAGTRNGLPVFRAVAWTPHELSFAPVPVDPGATVRAQGGSMDTTTTTPPAITPPAHDSATRATINGQIRAMCQTTGLGTTVSDGLIDRGASLEDARAVIFDAMLTRSAGRPLAAIQVLADHDEPGAIIDRMGTAFAVRATERLPERHRVAMSDAARPFADRSLLDLAAELADRRGSPIGQRQLAPSVLYTRAMTTGDFPALLANVANKVLLPAYQNAAPTYRRFFARRDLRDYKPASLVRIGDFPVPLALGENAEYKEGAISDSGQTAQLAHYGRIISLSRQALINDDLNGFANLPNKAALRVADWENSVAWAMITSNPTLADGFNLFDASHHGNQAAGGAPISVATVGAGESAMMKQVSLDGLKLNLRPTVLAVSPDSLTVARQFVTQITPHQMADVNPFAGTIDALGDANLSGPGWYLFSDATALESFNYGYLQGAAGPQITPEPGFDVAGMRLRLSIDFYVQAVDFRGAYFNPGQ